MYMYIHIYTEHYFSCLDVTTSTSSNSGKKLENFPHDVNVNDCVSAIIDHIERIKVAGAITRVLILEAKKHSPRLARHLQT